MISQDELKEAIRRKGGTVYEHKEPVGIAVNGRLRVGVGCLRIDRETACDILSDGSASCWKDGLNYDVSPGVLVPEAEMPIATEEDIERTKRTFKAFSFNVSEFQRVFLDQRKRGES